jgi:hypothetical protein
MGADSQALLARFSVREASSSQVISYLQLHWLTESPVME